MLPDTASLEQLQKMDKYRKKKILESANIQKYSDPIFRISLQPKMDNEFECAQDIEKDIRECKYIERDFYSYGFSNNDLEN